jgi:FKBP-type peptidyl-prolyl cis-trans isomerase SlyD
MFVSVAFRLYDAGGDLLDEVTAEEPLAYVHGYAQIVPGLEKARLGAEAGEELSIVVLPEDAFGAHDPDALLEIDPNDFPEAAAAAVGGEVVATGPDGVEAVHRIVEVAEDAIIVDLNHPLAGETIRFEALVCSVRPATDEELDAAQAEMGERILRSHASESVGGDFEAAAAQAPVSGKRHLAIAHDGMVVYGSQSDDPPLGASTEENDE